MSIANKIKNSIFDELECKGAINLLNEEMVELNSDRQTGKLTNNNGNLVVADTDFYVKNEKPKYLGIFESSYGVLLIVAELTFNPQIIKDGYYKVSINSFTVAN